MSRLKAHVSIGSDRNVLHGDQITVETPDGEFQIGVDNYGETYVSTDGMHRICLIPNSSNRVIVKKEK